MALIRSIGTKKAAVSMHLAVGVAQSKLFFSFLNRCQYENYPNYPNDKNPGCNSLRFSNVKDKNAMSELKPTH
jgi:hypothetical protein